MDPDFSNKGHVACRICFLGGHQRLHYRSDAHSGLLVLPCIATALQLQFGHFLYILVFTLDFSRSSMVLACFVLSCVTTA